jgi:sugar diacid utilization regulator
VVALEDIDLYPGFAWGGVAHEQGYRALVSVPLRRAGAVVGALNGYLATPHRFESAEITMVTTLATQVAIALGTAQLRAREQDTIRELRKAEEVHRLLTATALRGEGVSGVAAGLAELLGRAVLIADMYDEALADIGWGDDSPWLMPATGSSTNNTSAEQSTADAELETGGVVAGPASTTTAGVVLDGRAVARIHVRAPRRELSGLDVRAIEHAAVVTALELLRARTAGEVEQRLRGSLVADLLSGERADIASLLDRARRMGWNLSGYQSLVVVRGVETNRSADQPASERLLSAADRLVARVKPRPLAAAHGDDLILVWAQGARGTTADGSLAGVASQLIDSLTAAGTVERGVAAVAPAAPIAELPRAYRTVRGALELAVDSGSSTVVDLNDAAIDHLLLQLDDPPRLREFARTILGAAIDYDQIHATELLRTARVLIDHDLDRRAAAAALHLHPNTVQQRMRRLEGLTGMRPSRPRDLMQLTAALTVARIAGLG